MIIGIDARALAFPGTGNARYLHQVLRYLIPMRKKDTFVFFSHREIHPEYQHLQEYPNVILDPNRSKLPGLIWMQWEVPALLEAHKVDVFWGTITLLPLKKTTAQIVNFHDLNSFVARDTMEGWTGLQHRLMNPRIIRQADQVLCLSRTTREHIRRHIKGVEPAKLTVVYPGFEMPETKPARPPGFKSTWKDFLLMVGTIEPRKNQKVVVDGYRHARARYQASLKSRSDTGRKGLPPLLIVGRKGWKNEEFYALLKSGALEKEGIYFLEGASEAELAWCYKNSGYLLFPSKHEGFGLPILEAFAYGKNCLLSDIEVFREIGQGCRFAAPTDFREWARQILEIADPKVRSKEKPRKLNMKDWSWKRAARQVSRALDDSLRIHNVKN
ncbi:MAG TPA: glycosyl transferase [Leptospiraceae bacterium]|nr:glycosyl transferase [Spirochaetaceae bacterium]HBS04350.1 glycosyl transferase [Leptospiraceae bacterium]|tara:strand:+ start:4074 stop:5228 length:1155 start_codon:yes stop_codon:yes gene_type:complete